MSGVRGEHGDDLANRARRYQWQIVLVTLLAGALTPAGYVAPYWLAGLTFWDGDLSLAWQDALTLAYQWPWVGGTAALVAQSWVLPFVICWTFQNRPDWVATNETIDGRINRDYMRSVVELACCWAILALPLLIGLFLMPSEAQGEPGRLEPYSHARFWVVAALTVLHGGTVVLASIWRWKASLIIFSLHKGRG
jgi:hypothetical protein